MRKRAFLLLEILVALSIVGLCLYPLLYSHFAVFKENNALFEKVEFERLAEIAHLDALRMIAEDKDLNFDSIGLNVHKRLSQDAILNLNQDQEISYERWVTFNFSSEKEIVENDTLRLLDIKIDFISPKGKVLSYTYTQVIARYD